MGAKLYSAEEARALLEARRSKGTWAQAHHIDEPRALVEAERPMFSMLGLDSDGMAIFNEASDAALAVAAPDLAATVASEPERLDAERESIAGLVAEASTTWGALTPREQAAVTGFAEHVERAIRARKTGSGAAR